MATVNHTCRGHFQRSGCHDDGDSLGIRVSLLAFQVVAAAVILAVCLSDACVCSPPLKGSFVRVRPHSARGAAAEGRPSWDGKAQNIQPVCAHVCVRACVCPI